MARALLIDLDDTLYDERTYVLSGFRAVGTEVARRFGADADRLFRGMVAELDAHGRGKVFDRALEAAGVAADRAVIDALVEIYRDHQPDIALWPGVAEALDALAGDYRMAVVTDGLARMQRRKVEALELERRVEHVLLCWDHEAPKPDPTCYIEALRRFGARPEEAVVIGDNPEHDMAAAKAIGAHSIRVMTGRFARQGDAGFAPDATAASFPDVVAILQAKFGAAA